MIKQIKASIENYPDKNAFYIQKKYTTYFGFGKIISIIKKEIEKKSHPSEKLIGFLTYDDIESYSSALAILFASKGFIPINPQNPIERNISIIDQTGIGTILSSTNDNNIIAVCKERDIKFINTKQLQGDEIDLSIPDINEDEIAYLLFTSGSTGIPKGVPISGKNLNSFIDAFFALGYDVNEDDRVLQMFDMTFDLSLMSYLVPLCKGACVYTIPQTGIKYLNIASIMDEHQITIALMVPSIIAYLRPYFDQIRLKKMKYSLFCGEALYNEIVTEWQNCVPNAQVQNVYGPTEATIFCFSYDLNTDISNNKTANGIVSIGKPMKNVEAVVVDENNNIVDKGEKGELCLAGSQVTSAYWKNEKKNSEAFIYLTIDNQKNKYYKTGDLVMIDEEDDCMYYGRIDNQIKIQGFRVELSEIEHHVREFTNINLVKAISINSSKDGNTQINLFLENYPGDTSDIIEYLSTKIPKYMIPDRIFNIPLIPLNSNGKVDKNALIKIMEN